MRNPFESTKATELSDQSVHALWVAPHRSSSEVPEILRPLDCNSQIVVGAKGCGKTHVLRWHSSSVQRIRNRNLVQAVQNERFLGLYLLCRTLDAGRFFGGELTTRQWSALFGYYLELWFSEAFVRLLQDYKSDGGFSSDNDVLNACLSVFARPFSTRPCNLAELTDSLSKCRRSLDDYLNNVLFDETICAPPVTLSPGAGWFNLPSAVSEALGERRFTTLIMLDEVENLSPDQQHVVQDRVRHRTGDVSLRVCGRSYGFRTFATTTGEVNRDGSEYKQIELSSFWGREQDFGTAASELCRKRIELTGSSQSIEELLEAAPDWPEIEHLIMEHPLGSSVRMRNLERALAGRSPKWIAELKTEIAKFSPLRQQSSIAAIRSGRVSLQMRPADVAAAANDQGARLERHFGSDFKVQIVEETKILPAQWEYCGWDGLLRMASRNPRVLLNTLRAAFDWWLYSLRDGATTRPVRLSLQHQADAVVESSNAYELAAVDYDTEGDGARARRGVAAVCEFLSAWRRAAVPPEPSPSTFSVPSGGASDVAESALRAAVLYGLLEPTGRRYKNVKARGVVYQVVPPLCPKHGLPLSRRGVAALSRSDLETLFGAEQDGEALRKAIERLAGRSGLSTRDEGLPVQRDLFGENLDE